MSIDTAVDLVLAEVSRMRQLCDEAGGVEHVANEVLYDAILRIEKAEAKLHRKVARYYDRIYRPRPDRLRRNQEEKLSEHEH